MNETLNKVDLEEIKEKLYEKLKPSGWANKLKTFILSQDMTKILETLLKQAKEGKRFTPVLKQVFRAFEECPYNELKVIVCGQDSYPYQGVADGIAFSCGNTGKPEASLRYIFKEVQETVYNNGEYMWDPDLKRWSNQGILLINCALTTTIGKIGQHYEIWRPFMSFLFDMLAFDNSGLVYVFMGKVSQEWAKSVPGNNFKIFTSHPASAAYRDLEKWDSGDMFNKVSRLIKDNYDYDIIW